MRIEFRAPQRSFQMTIGLVAGYEDDGQKYSGDDVLNAMMDWVKPRVRDGRPRITGAVFPGTLTYGRMEGDEFKTKREPSVELRGDLHPHFQAEMTNEEALEILIDLADAIAAALNQTRIWLNFGGETMVLNSK